MPQAAGNEATVAGEGLDAVVGRSGVEAENAAVKAGVEMSCDGKHSASLRYVIHWCFLCTVLVVNVPRLGEWSCKG